MSGLSKSIVLSSSKVVKVVSNGEEEESKSHKKKSKKKSSRDRHRRRDRHHRSRSRSPYSRSRSPNRDRRYRHDSRSRDRSPRDRDDRRSRGRSYERSRKRSRSRERHSSSSSSRRSQPSKKLKFNPNDVLSKLLQSGTVEVKPETIAMYSAMPLKIDANDTNPENVSRAARTLYVGGMPVDSPDLTEANLLNMFRRMCSSSTIADPILSVWLSRDRQFCLVEFRSVLDATAFCDLLQGISLEGVFCEVGRPPEYKGADATPGLSQFVVGKETKEDVEPPIVPPSENMKVVNVSNTPTNVLCLTNIIHPSALECEATTQLILDDMRDWATPFGTVAQVVMVRGAPSARLCRLNISANIEKEGQMTLDPSVDELPISTTPGQAGRVFISFTDAEYAKRCFGSFTKEHIYYRGRRFGVNFFDPNALAEKNYS